LREGTREIEDIVEKPSIADAPSRLADFGRMILNSGVVDVLKRTQLGKGNELWIVDAIREYVRSGQKFLVKEVQDGKGLTTGDPLNYLRAVLLYALDRKGIGEELLSFLRGLLMDPVRK
jgi:UTP--glucose-1-phosphate uridylyltransferase